MTRCGLEGATEGNRRLVAERPANQLQSDRQPVPRLSGRNFEHREAEIVDRSHEARDCLDGGLCAGAAATSVSSMVGAAALEAGAMTTSMPSIAAR